MPHPARPARLARSAAGAARAACAARMRTRTRTQLVPAFAVHAREVCAAWCVLLPHQEAASTMAPIGRSLRNARSARHPCIGQGERRLPPARD
jgi:hypothetical protein